MREISAKAPTAGPPASTGAEHDLPPVFGCEELARFLLVDIKTVQGIAQRSEIPCRKVGKAYRFFRPAVMEWLLGGHSGRWSKR